MTYWRDRSYQAEIGEMQTAQATKPVNSELPAFYLLHHGIIILVNFGFKLTLPSTLCISQKFNRGSSVNLGIF